MKCDANCEWGEEASIFFSYIENNKVVKVNLCKYCANEKGIADPTGYSLIDLMQGMGEETSSGKKAQKANELTCGNCGFTQSDFKKTGRFGCSRCYQVFNDGLESLLEAMHKNTEHAGKVPSFIEAMAETAQSPESGFDELLQIDLEELPSIAKSDKPNPEMSIAILKDQLDIAVSEEDYEEAARLRDEITQIESGTTGSP